MKHLKARARVDLRDVGDVRRWASYFGCTVQQLIDCVNIVGFSIIDVQRYLASTRDRVQLSNSSAPAAIRSG